MTGNASLLRRAILRVLAKVIAGGIHLLYGYIGYISRQLFITQAESDMLDSPHGAMRGIPRNSGSFATGIVQFSGTESTVIPKDTLLQNISGIEFLTTVSGTITGGVINIDIVAKESGISGNVVDTTLELVSPIDGVNNSVLVILAPSGGLDLESDDDYRARMLEFIQNPPMGGNKTDYEIWVRSIAGVGNAWCLPLERGGGTVDVIFKASGSNPVPSGALIAEVEDYIDSVKPVTADVSILPVNPKEVTFWIAFPDGSTDTDMQASITSNLQDLFDNTAAPKTNLPIAYIRDAIMTSGASDYDILGIEVDAVGVPIDDIVMSNEDDYPTLGTIGYSDL
jgi:uncharacterized phage protein gp47/JayE